MKNTAPAHTGRHFLQIPGPTNVPDRVLQAIAMPTIDHRGPEFAALGQEIVAGMKRVFQTDDTVVVYPSSGTGAWEAALSNTLSPGDHVIMFETGHFAALWRQMATRLGLEVEFVPGDWRHGVDPALVEEKLTADGGQESHCGWLKDKFGVSWQIVPTVLIEMLQDKDSEKSGRVMKAMLQMQKIDVKTLKEAYAGSDR